MPGEFSVLVVVIAVPCVAVPVMDVIDVVPVLNGLMAATLSMGVLGHGVVSVGVGSAHSFSFLHAFSRAWAIASRTTCSTWQSEIR